VTAAVVLERPEAPAQAFPEADRRAEFVDLPRQAVESSRRPEGGHR
jgi:hypothetical protein